MTYVVPIEEAALQFPQFEFLAALTPSEQKAAFQVRSQDGRVLCLKLISPTYNIDRLNREIAALQEIASPNVVRFEEYTYSSKAGQQLHYIVEEYVDGQDLADHLTAGETWSHERVCEFFSALYAGLEALRKADVVHRDLKPHNIRVRPNGSPVIIDLGLARLLTSPDITRTAEGAAIGTPLYFAPEQFRGTKRDIDHRTDLFATGILMYQALTGLHPFYRPGLTLGELEAAVCEGEAHFAREAFRALPTRWQVLLRSLLARSRAKRPLSAAQAANLLATLRGAQ